MTSNKNSEHSNLLARYDSETRQKPVVTAGLGLEKRDAVIALVGHFNFVCAWNFPHEHHEHHEQMEAVVDAWARRFRDRGEALMWPVYSHDQPTTLPKVLEAAGFIPEETATLMVAEAHKALRHIKTDDAVDVRRVQDSNGLRDYIDAGEAAFGEADTWQRRAFSQRLNDPDLGLYAAYAEEKPVASGRIEMDKKRSFAELYGGGVAPSHRGTGLYKALVEARAQAALDFGSSHLATTARETSRPILEKLGFVGLGTRTTWMLRP